MLSKEQRARKVEITLDRYVALIEADMELKSLLYEGVNNWIGYGPAQQNFVQDYVESHPEFRQYMDIKLTDVLDDIDIRTIAEFEAIFNFDFAQKL